MKKLLFILALALASLSGTAQKIGDTTITNNASKLRLKVFYFHITNRCNTCTSIEITLRKTLFENFKNEIDSGVIDVYILNCELPENKDLVKKYDAYGATMAVTAYDGPRELKTEDLTNFAFQKVHKPEVFISELKEKIQKYIK